ncbi:MAG: hypothetical protein Q4A27_00805 [bacterium]|nr:hypothetical protein [bacterium]
MTFAKLDLELRALQALYLEQELAIDFYQQKAVIKISPDFVRRNPQDEALEIRGSAKIIHLAGNEKSRKIHATEIARVQVLANSRDEVIGYKIAPEVLLEEKIVALQKEELADFDLEFPPFLRQKQV